MHEVHLMRSVVDNAREFLFGQEPGGDLAFYRPTIAALKALASAQAAVRGS